MVNTFLYKDVVSISRPTGQTAIGAVGYGGVLKSAESPIASGLPASIQARSAPTRPHSGDVPAAAPGPVIWVIYLPPAVLSNGIIVDRDIVTDQVGNRYQIDANYWSSLGYKLITVRLEAR